jgi:hypothetical protein
MTFCSRHKNDEPVKPNWMIDSALPAPVQSRFVRHWIEGETSMSGWPTIHALSAMGIVV